MLVALALMEPSESTNRLPMSPRPASSLIPLGRLPSLFVSRQFWVAADLLIPFAMFAVSLSSGTLKKVCCINTLSDLCLMITPNHGHFYSLLITIFISFFLHGLTLLGKWAYVVRCFCIRHTITPKTPKCNITTSQQHRTITKHYYELILTNRRRL